jgi:hypothetical protein
MALNVETAGLRSQNEKELSFSNVCAGAGKKKKMTLVRTNSPSRLQAEEHLEIMMCLADIGLYRGSDSLG